MMDNAAVGRWFVRHCDVIALALAASTAPGTRVCIDDMQKLLESANSAAPVPIERCQHWRAEDFYGIRGYCILQHGHLGPHEFKGEHI